ncbi:hypothetical protein TIFTF001_016912 [Ficus carica]|uniref:Uncharacterized protein n=1 Tax=Ficus carica TaxID=3494 RepID=A0AA88A8C9_FICCA|nr:hypothetical protein TIFTF001_016912 [Ficus carica]
MISLVQSFNTWSPAKRKHLGSDLDTSRVSVNDTLLFKSVVILVSKQRDRALARKNCLYLNKWADPLFIGIPCGHGCSGDLVELNSGCSRWVDMLQTTGAGDRTGAVASGSKGPTEQEVLSSCQGNVVRANNTGPDHVPLWVGSGERQVPGEGEMKEGK